MKKTDSEKIDQIIGMLGDVVEIFGKRFDKTDEKIEALTSELSEVKSAMATKEELSEVKEELAEVKGAMATGKDLGVVRRDVEFIKEKVASHDGFAKEVDHVLSRVVVLEKHVGIVSR